MKRGDSVTFVDANGSTHTAEVRGVVNANDPTSVINLHVTGETAETLERIDVPNEAHKVAGQGFWRAK
jgi:hypothetical protein